MTNVIIIVAILIGDICTAEGVTASGPTPVLALCRALVAAGHDPATRMHVFRDHVLALTVRSIGAGARLTVRETTRDGRPRFAPWRSGGPPRSRFPAPGAPEARTAPGAGCGRAV
jgi:hypothetical protein